MGFAKHKYTREYFTGRDSLGHPLDYGALGADAWLAGGIFAEIKAAVDLVDLNNKTVLEIGYGRGEAARYMLQRKGIKSYVGVDFSESALEIALKTLSGCNSSRYRLVQQDALVFLQQEKFESCFDVVFMLDTIEHIPKAEVRVILPLLSAALCSRGYLILTTPFYSIDEDYIAQKYRYLQPSASDLHPATAGMHCNKYTKERLLNEMSEAGFRIVSEKQFQKPGSSVVNRIGNIFYKIIAKML